MPKIRLSTRVRLHARAKRRYVVAYHMCERYTEIYFDKFIPSLVFWWRLWRHPAFNAKWSIYE